MTYLHRIKNPRLVGGVNQINALHSGGSNGAAGRHGAPASAPYILAAMEESERIGGRTEVEYSVLAPRFGLQVKLLQRVYRLFKPAQIAVAH